MLIETRSLKADYRASPGTQLSDPGEQSVPTDHQLILYTFLLPHILAMLPFCIGYFMSHKHPKSPEEWAALMGRPEAEATQIIKQTHPGVDVIPLNPGDCCIMNINYSRVAASWRRKSFTSSQTWMIVSYFYIINYLMPSILLYYDDNRSTILPEKALTKYRNYPCQSHKNDRADPASKAFGVV
jgi:hypothetical protein